jgi:uncharacterized protein GlcG (DUF336 family)
MTLDLAAARSIADGTLQQGRDHDAAPLAVAVLDAGGHVKAVLRDDGAGYLRVEIAIAKAWGALGMGQSSRRLADRAQQGQPEFFMSLVAVGRGRVALSAGGLLLADRDGQVIGAVGVSGDDASDVDEACAAAAIDACGYRTTP